MQNLKRNIHMGFRVTKEEQDMIRERMKTVHIHSLRAYLLKMAVDGYVINIDLADVRECSRLLRYVSNNVNQIARRVNAGGSVCAADVAEIQTRLDEVWKQQNKIIGSLAKVLEAA